MDIYNPSSIFTFIENFGIKTDKNKKIQFGDNEFLDFKKEYIKWSDNRDIFLLDYLNKNPKLFRTYIPKINFEYKLASQIVWYFDELLIRDPIYFKLLNDNIDIQNQKETVVKALELLFYFKDLIDSGYLLPYGSLISEQSFNIRDEVLDNLITDNELYVFLINETEFGYKEEFDFRGNKLELYRISLESYIHLGNKITFQKETKFEKGEVLSHFPFYLEGGLDIISYKEFICKFKNENKNIDEIFKSVIKNTLINTYKSQKASSVILFDKKYHSIILNKSNLYFNPQKQINTIGNFNLTLPYVKNIPPERLIDLKLKMPNAFLDFRNNLNDIIKDAMSEDINSKEEFENYINSKILTQISSLEKEIVPALKRANLWGNKFKLSVALGILAGGLLNIPLVALFGVLNPILLKKWESSIELSATKESISKHPFYFLWEAKK